MMSFYWTSLLLIAPIAGLFYLYIKKQYSYWSSRGISGPSPHLLHLGNIYQIARQKNPPAEEFTRVQQYGKVYGMYNCFSPTLTIADPVLIKQMMIKDFQHFVNHRELFTYDELINNFIFFAADGHWKRIRTITTPAFSSGKLRNMVPIMQNCTDKLTEYLRKLTTEDTGVMITRKVLLLFSFDVIASNVYATEMNALQMDQNSDPLLKHCLEFLDISPFQALCALAMPRWFNDLLGVRHFFSQKGLDYVRQFIGAIVERRQTGQEVRDDLLQALIDSSVSEDELNDADYGKLEVAREQHNDSPQAANLPSAKSTTSKRNTQLTDIEILSHAILFFFAGTETTASILTHLIFELSHQTEAQERLITELHDALDGLELNSAEYINRLMKLPYLEAVLSETLRMYPPAIRLERRCSLDGYQIAGITLKKNQLIEVSTFGVHYNPEYYPDPHRFNPDRFLPENAHKRLPYTFLPFGVGPRNCIGLRYANQSMKLAIGTIFRQFRFHPTAQTPKRLEFLPSHIMLTAKLFETKVELQ